MISAIHGKVEWRNPESVVINVSGLSFLVLIPSSVPDSFLEPGANIKLYTYLHFRENVIALYGFLSRQDEELFRILLTVSGIGPKIALSIISALKPEELVQAVATGNPDMLIHIPGIGKKTASRLMLELKDKLVGVGTVIPGISEDRADVIAALTNLGFSPSEAMAAVSSLGEARELSLEDKVKLALKNINTRS